MVELTWDSPAIRPSCASAKPTDPRQSHQQCAVGHATLTAAAVVVVPQSDPSPVKRRIIAKKSVVYSKACWLGSEPDLSKWFRVTLSLTSTPPADVAGRTDGLGW